jgi:hypothetical protein
LRPCLAAGLPLSWRQYCITGNNYVSAGAVLGRLEWGECVQLCRDRAKGAWEDAANGTRPASSLLTYLRPACVLILLGLHWLLQPSYGPFFLSPPPPLETRFCLRRVLHTADAWYLPSSAPLAYRGGAMRLVSISAIQHATPFGLRWPASQHAPCRAGRSPAGLQARARTS